MIADFTEYTVVVVTNTGDYGGDGLCHVGEIMMLDGNGRDVLGNKGLVGGRNPSKWGIEVERVATLAELIEAAERDV